MVLNVVVVLGVGRGVVVLWCCGVRCVLSPPQWTPEPVHRGWAGRTEGDSDESGGEGDRMVAGEERVGGVGAPWPDQHKLNSLHSDFEAFN